ncbi:MAG TPA: hypothetical protein VF585_11140, partial [Chthoniobacterales bacterium]
ENGHIAEPPLTRIVTSVEVNADPAVVWPRVVEFSAIPPPKEWVFKTGIAYPPMRGSKEKEWAPFVIANFHGCLRRADYRLERTAPPRV